MLLPRRAGVKSEIPWTRLYVANTLLAQRKADRQLQSGSGQVRLDSATRLVRRTWFDAALGHRLLTDRAANVTNSNTVCSDCDWITQDKYAVRAASH